MIVIYNQKLVSINFEYIRSKIICINPTKCMRFLSLCIVFSIPTFWQIINVNLHSNQKYLAVEAGYLG